MTTPPDGADLDKPVKKKDYVAAVLRDEIGSRLQPGDMLESEAKLGSRFGVSRTTVRDAIDVLKSEGLISVHHGKGATVRLQSHLAVRIHPRTLVDEGDPAAGGPSYFDPDVDDHQWQSPTEPSHRMENASVEEALAIGVREHAQLFVYEKLLVAAGGRRMIHRLYLPYDTLRERQLLQDRTFRNAAELYSNLQAAGYDLDWREFVFARMPPPQDAVMLKIPDGIPLLITRRITSSDGGRPFAMEEIRISAENTQLLFQVRVQSPSSFHKTFGEFLTR
jgi:GntR family transcriptional regulator